MQAELTMKNSYINNFKKAEVKERDEVEEKKNTESKFGFDKVFESYDENQGDDDDGYWKKFKRDSHRCKQRQAPKDHKDQQDAPLTTAQSIGWREPYDNLTFGYNRSGMCMRTFQDKGHL